MKNDTLSAHSLKSVTFARATTFFEIISHPSEKMKLIMIFTKKRDFAGCKDAQVLIPSPTISQPVRSRTKKVTASQVVSFHEVLYPSFQKRGEKLERNTMSSTLSVAVYLNRLRSLFLKLRAKYDHKMSEFGLFRRDSSAEI